MAPYPIAETCTVPTLWVGSLVMVEWIEELLQFCSDLDCIIWMTIHIDFLYPASADPLIEGSEICKLLHDIAWKMKNQQESAQRMLARIEGEYCMDTKYRFITRTVLSTTPWTLHEHLSADDHKAALNMLEPEIQWQMVDDHWKITPVTIIIRLHTSILHPPPYGTCQVAFTCPTIHLPHSFPPLWFQSPELSQLALMHCHCCHCHHSFCPLPLVGLAATSCRF